jgi:hypothetical protein
MKKLVLLVLLSLVLTSCMTAVKTKEIIEETKVEVEKNETPEVNPEEPEEIDEEKEISVIEPEKTEEETLPSEKSPEKPSEKKDEIPSEDNETEALTFDFNNVTEENVESILEALNWGESFEFPAIPLTPEN